jgi:LemA protein
MKYLKPSYIIIGIILILLIMGYSQYNGMVTKNEQVENAVGNLNTQYQRRSDLLNNLIEIVKREANYEKSTLKDIIDARARASNGGAPSLDPKNLTQAQIDEFSKRAASDAKIISVIVENYPNLRATEAYQDLMRETTGTENRVGVARDRFNTAVQEYNLAVKRFPGVLFAKMYGYKEKAYFQNNPGTQDAPDMKNKDF